MVTTSGVVRDGYAEAAAVNELGSGVIKEGYAEEAEATVVRDGYAEAAAVANEFESGEVRDGYAEAELLLVGVINEPYAVTAELTVTNNVVVL